MGLFSSGRDNLFLGIDIGDSSIKMVELRRRGKKIYLNNYAFSENVGDLKFTRIDDIDYLASAIMKIKEKAGITSSRAVASLPTFSVFSSIISLSGVDKKNLGAAVIEEAKKVIPLPLEEMILDWKVIPEEAQADKKNVRVFLTGSPKKLVKKYIDIFKKAKLELASIETETFSIVRSLLGSDKTPVMIVEIGADSTDLSIVRESIPVLNRSLEISGNTVTDLLSQNLGLDRASAEQFKFDLSISLSEDNREELPQLILQALQPIINEMEYMLDFFQSQNNGRVEKIILSGGGSLLLNLAEFLSKKLNTQVIIGDPWNRVSYPTELRPVVLEVGPKLAVAIGLALREIE